MGLGLKALDALKTRLIYNPQSFYYGLMKHTATMTKTMTNNTDNIFNKQQDMIIDFAFDESVAKVFPNMIRRSVPGYATVISLTGLFAQQYIQANSNVYDLGCSLGASTTAILKRPIHLPFKLIAVDNSAAMIEQCKENLAMYPHKSVALLHNDLQEVVIENASFVILNFTLQFTPIERRQELLQSIYNGLMPGGALMLSEKIIFPEQQDQNFHDAMHQTFKRANGYNDLEISQKRQALENILLPESLETHIHRMQKCGFQDVHKWFQCFNFCSFIAIK